MLRPKETEQESKTVRIVNEELLEYFRTQKCELCGSFMSRRITCHHVYCRGMGGGSRLDVVLNLVSLCMDGGNGCHEKIQVGGKAAQIQCWELVAKREGLESWEVARDAVWRLLRSPKK